MVQAYLSQLDRDYIWYNAGRVTNLDGIVTLLQLNVDAFGFHFLHKLIKVVWQSAEKRSYKGRGGHLESAEKAEVEAKRRSW